MRSSAVVRIVDGVVEGAALDMELGEANGIADGVDMMKEQHWFEMSDSTSLADRVTFFFTGVPSNGAFDERPSTIWGICFCN